MPQAAGPRSAGSSRPGTAAVARTAGRAQAAGGRPRGRSDLPGQFTREAFAAAQIEHPNLVALRELGSDRGHHYAALDWIDGPSAAELLESRGKGSSRYQAAVVVLQAARGLKAAHEQGLRIATSSPPIFAWMPTDRYGSTTWDWR